ncbi:MAG: hypothetical protein ACOC44_19250 [Promethearchaeia archaeon]
MIDETRKAIDKKKTLLKNILNVSRGVLNSIISLVSVFSNIKFLIFFTIMIAIFMVFSFIPYANNLNDEARIIEHQNNIELYEDYIDDYTESARKQIEEFQEMQSEMASKATSDQLQFWSLQQDEVGDALTEQIKVFNDKIRELELDINERKGNIESRKSNKWYFFLED